METILAQSQPFSLLVVDDDARVRRGLRALFDSLNDIQVVGEAANANEAREQVERLRPAVIVLDLLLPDAHDGLQLLRYLVSMRAVTVVAISARDGLRAEAIAAGADAFLDKGSRPDRVIQVVRHAQLRQMT